MALPDVDQRRPRSRAGRRLLAATAGLVVAAVVVPGCQDASSTSGDPATRPAGRSTGDGRTPDDRGAQPQHKADRPSRGTTDALGQLGRPGAPGTVGPAHGRGDDAGHGNSGNGNGPGSTTTGAGWSGPRFGAVYHGMWDMTWSDRAELLDKLASIGVRWVRIGMQWSLVQPNSPSSEHGGWSVKWGLPKADRVINQAVQRGLQVSVTFLRTPNWANGGRGPEYLPSDPSTYARAIEQLAHRYQGRVDSWEIYNETNNQNHLRASVADYVRLLCAAYPAVHRGDPGAKVVFGGTSGNDSEYIDAAYRNGAKGCFDVLATHPYNSNLSPKPPPPSDHGWWFRNIKYVRDVMLRNGDGATPVWFTELGWSTHPNTARMTSSERGVTRAQQARYALQALRITKRDYPYVDRMAWYAARDETNSTLDNNNFGLYTLDLQPKPAAIAIQRFFASQ
ncbi:MAG TPA: cellulase family glycosylhydrolase [Nocardioidaceae bacterium]|nr:cellulase family glycosylhydrolase [Nocardioidaceae bacterium]